jgi:hypothetical protein
MTTISPAEQTSGARLPFNVVLVWVLVALAAVAVAVFAPIDQSISWLPVVLGGGIFATFVVQLAIVRKEGLVMRIVLSVSGALVILAVTTGLLAVARLQA